MNCTAPFTLRTSRFLARTCSVLGALSALALCDSAWAQPAPVQNAAAAQSLFEQAVTDMESRDFAHACPKLEEASRLAPDALGAKEQLATCYEGLGRLASAWSQWNVVEAIASRTGDKERGAKATERLAILKPRLASLEIVVPTNVARLTGLKVTRDGTEIGPSQWSNPLEIDAGSHVVSASAPGFAPFQKETKMLDGQKGLIEVPNLTPLAAGAVPPPSGATAPSTNHWQVPLGGVALALGGAALATGAIMGGLAISKNGESNVNGCDAATDVCVEPGLGIRNQARAFGNASTGLIIAGGVLAGAGLVIVLTAPGVIGKKDGTKGRALQTAPSVRAVFGVADVRLKGSF